MPLFRRFHDKVLEQYPAAAPKLTGNETLKRILNLLVTDLMNEIRQMVLKSSSSGEIREVAVRNGMHSLSDDGWRLIGMGITTPEEVMRVAKDQTFGKDKGGQPQDGTALKVA